MLKSIMKQYGNRRKLVVAYEWEHWKRIFQFRPKHRWRGRKAKTATVVARLYREDPKADEDWSSVVERLPDNRPVPPCTSASDKEALQREWLVATLRRNAFYSLSHQVEEPTSEGGVQSVERSEFFQVRSVHHAKKQAAFGAHVPVRRGPRSRRQYRFERCVVCA